MASLLDIGPLTEEVDIHGTKVTVNGLSAADIFRLFADFPDMGLLLKTGEGSAQDVVMQLAPELLAKIIAMATGAPHDKEIEAKAKMLGAADQLAILMAVQRLSFPEGLGPFIERVTSLMGPMPTVVLPTSKSAPNSSRPLTALRSSSSASLQTDTPNLAHGRAPRAN